METDVNNQLSEAFKAVLNITEDEIENIRISGDLEKVRLLSVIRFLGYTERIKEDAYIFRLLGILFAIESLAAAKQKDKKSKVQKYLRENLDFEQKVQLLDGFIWSKKYEFRKEKIFPLRHIMFNDFDNDVDFKKNNCINDVEYCSAGQAPLCYCVRWLGKNPNNVDVYLDTLVAYFYEMRNAVVHESFPVLGLPDYKEIGAPGIFSSSLLDAFPVTKDKKYFRSYEAFVKPDIFFNIVKNCIKKYLMK